VREDQGDDLGVLVLEEGHELPDVGVPQRGEGHLAVRSVHPRQHSIGGVSAQAGGEDLAGELDATAADQLLAGHHAVELGQDAVDVLDLHRTQTHQLPRQRLHLARPQLGQQDAGLLLAHLGEEDRGLPEPGHRAVGRRPVVPG
jgi:hypothetical protein